MAKIDSSIGRKYEKCICTECTEKINQFHIDNPKFRSRVYMALHGRKYFKKIMGTLCDECKQLLLVEIKTNQLKGGRR